MSISLNDHEQRIKNIDGQLSSISDRINKLEDSAPNVFKLNTSVLGEFATNNRGWEKDITNMIPTTITSNTHISSTGIGIALHMNGWDDPKQIGQIALSKNVNISHRIGNASTGRARYLYFRFQNSRLVIGHSNLDFTRQTYIRLSGVLTFVTSDKL